MTQPDKSAPDMKVLMFLWVQFAISFGLFAFVLFTATKGAEPRPDVLMEMGPPFGIIALALLVAMPFVRTKVQGAQTVFGLMQPPPAGQWDSGLDETTAEALMAAATQKYRTGMLIGLALCEAPVLFGFALGFTSSIPLAIAPFMIVGFLGLVVQFPTTDGIEAVARALKASPESDHASA